MKKRTTRLHIHRETLAQLDTMKSAAGGPIPFDQVGKNSRDGCTSPFCGPSTCLPCE